MDANTYSKHLLPARDETHVFIDAEGEFIVINQVHPHEQESSMVWLDATDALTVASWLVELASELGGMEQLS